MNMVASLDYDYIFCSSAGFKLFTCPNKRHKNTESSTPKWISVSVNNTCCTMHLNSIYFLKMYNFFFFASANSYIKIFRHCVMASKTDHCNCTEIYKEKNRHKLLFKLLYILYSFIFFRNSVILCRIQMKTVECTTTETR